jgi:STE24 endopeptidase
MFFMSVIILVTAYSVSRILLDLHQIKYIKSTHISDDELNLIKLNQEYVEKSKLYNIEKLYLSVFNTVIKSSIIIIFLAFDGISLFGNISNIINIFTINIEVFNIILFIVILTLIDLPFSYYKIFFIENHYGFNRQSKLLFFKDLILSLTISLIILSMLFIVFNKLYNIYVNDWWLYMWLIVIVFNTLVIYLFPIIISPLFNSFKKINDEEIISEIKDLSDKTNFNISNVYVMDGSKRSNHSNAYFTGFYKNKRIVFYDTLIDLLTPSEIRSVLAHEIGHYMKKHIMKSMIINFFMSFLFFYIIYQIVSIEMLFEELGINKGSSSQIVILFSLLLPCVLYFITPLFSILSRKNEYEADNYAKLYSDKNDLISSLLKLYKENLNLIKSSPIYSAVYNSHPTVFERINNLKL